MKYDLNSVANNYAFDFNQRDCILIVPYRCTTTCREVAVSYWIELNKKVHMDTFFIQHHSDIGPKFKDKCMEFGIEIETDYYIANNGIKFHSFKVPEIFRYNSIGMYIFVDIIRRCGLGLHMYENYSDPLIKAYIQNHESWFKGLEPIKNKGPIDMLFGALQIDQEVEVFCRMIRSLPYDTDIFKYLFVYGSLRRGKDNYKHYLMRNLEFACNKNIPGIRRLGAIQAKRSSKEFQIAGEVWTVRKAGDLADLLDYEGHPRAWRLVPTRQDHSLFFEYQLGE